MKQRWNLLMLLAVILLVAVPLRIIRRPQPGPDGRAAEIFTGTDDQAKDAISEVAPGYRPWAHSLIKPPSREVESLLFALQAAIGAGFMGYYFGSRRPWKA